MSVELANIHTTLRFLTKINERGLQKTSQDEIIYSSFNSKTKEEANKEPLSLFSKIVNLITGKYLKKPQRILYEKKEGVTGKSKNAIRERRLREDTCYLQAVCLALFNFFGDFSLIQPKKRTNKTADLPRIHCIMFQETFVDVEELINTIYPSPVDCDERNKRSMLRICAHNRLYAKQNYLLDVLRRCGFFFESTFPFKTRFTIQQERVNSIYYRNKLLLKKEEIQEMGKQINQFFCEQSKIRINGIYDHDDQVFEKFLHEKMPIFYDKFSKIRLQSVN
ncbi:hypothetical protein EIN_247610 [Entamoeba invadens IP1]|uniref:Uncharacterized protein n=1 Tax=Entamoeba invadens IP1 TaxID=370355 RepID=A0A0A1UH76_ENTIV|nr:hypothetical protein EIN_247610 [Entamoeba invadens IP1]ELP94837.1 hypothetical protein EIN_247610 [Entamoeba invadens IP1]|eukprot:XP_004261608.1 hypothetical protein EIN_247610 [Entamoeba invadens IP1]